MPAIQRRDVSAAVAQLMPHIVRGTQLEFFVRRGVTQTQFLVLMSIHAYHECTMGRLARNLHVQMPTASGIVSRLFRAGYVHRAADPSDRRQVVVRLSPKGKAFVAEFQRVIRQRWDDVLAPLASHELSAFHRILTKLHAQLEPTHDAARPT